MKMAILANREASYVRPMAEGLRRMCSRLGGEATIFYDGLAELSRLPDKFGTYIKANGTGSYRIAKRVAKYTVREAPSVLSFVSQLRRFDVVVIVSSIPRAFLKSYFHDGTLRALLPHTPIVLYDVFYLPTRGPWGKWLKEGRREEGVMDRDNWGLERYDWYLCASVVSETPLPADPQPYSLIGLDLDDGTLRPEPKPDFIALLDFEYPTTMRERAIQIQALEESGTKFIVLNGQYSIDAIRKIYRKSSIYFLASRESFGLPICELQACGSHVFTPDTHWCPSHWLKTNLALEGPGELSPNFVVYGSDKDQLIREIHRVKSAYDPNTVFERFRKYHPQFFRGDEEELRRFMQKVQAGIIHSLSHKNYGDIRGLGYFPSFSPDPPLSSAA